MDEEQRQSTQQSLSEHRTRLSPSSVGSVYPALQNLQRISQGHGDAHSVAAHCENSTGTTLINDHYTSQTLPFSNTPGYGQGQPLVPHHHSSFDHNDGPSVISTSSLPSYPLSSTSSSHPVASSPHLESSLPDILHSHMVQQVPQSRPNHHRQHRNRNPSRRDGLTVGAGHHRTQGSRHRRRHRVHSVPSTPQTQEGTCKEPCVKCVVVITTFRWVLVVLSILGVFCVVTGIVLAAIRSAGNSFLFLAIMFIGLGVLLVIVVGVGWKCTPRGHEPLHALFGIGNFRHGHSRTRHPRRHRNRDGNWFGGYLYPEFQYRRPPPSYAASMQDYQNQDIPSDSVASVVQDSTLSAPSSPPPSYRSRASTVHSGIHITFNHDGDLPNSRPPTYRSRAPSRRPSIILDDSHASLYASQEGDSTEIAHLNDGLQGLVSSEQPSSSVTLLHVKNVTNEPHLTPILLPSSQSSDNIGAQNLHQRMASEDRQILEQTLQSLEEHISESGGFTNEGARFDELEIAPDYNTYL